MRYPYMFDQSPFWVQSGWIGFITPLLIWTLAWTALVLWHAAKRGEKGWFLFFFFVHTAGIVEIIYLLFVAHAFGQESTVSKKHRRAK